MPASKKCLIKIIEYIEKSVMLDWLLELVLEEIHYLLHIDERV